MNTPIRKYQQEKDYLRHKLFRKMKRRRKALIESAKDAPVRALRRKLGIPKFAEGKNASRTLQFVGDDGRILDDLGDDMMVLYDESDGYGDDPANWVYVNDRTGETYVPNIRANNGTIQSKGDWSGLSRLAALSNAYRNNPILGAPARLYDSWNNAMDNSIGINPLDIAGLVATLAGASSIRRPLTPKQLSKMSLLELGNYFKANPQLLRDIEVTDNVRKFYNNDVLPRLAKLNKKPLGFTADDLINSLNFKAGNFDRNRYGGYYSSGDNAIVLNDRVLNDPRLLDRVLMHEISHGMYNRAGYTPEVASRLNTTYQFSPEYLAAHPGLQLLAELAAVNTETRGMISMDNGWVTGRELDGIVKNMDPFNLMRYFNGPGSSTYAKDWAKRFLPGLALQKATLSAVANPKDTIAALPKDSIGYKNGKLPGYYMGIPDGEIAQDNTYVYRPAIVKPIKRNFIAEAQRKHAAEAVGPDTRSSYQRKQSLAAKQYANQQYQKAKDDAKRAEGLEQMMKTISPSTYVEAATGLDLGTMGRAAIDAAIFGLPGFVKRGIKSAGNLAKIGKLDKHNYHVSAELTNEPINIPFEKYKKEAIQGSLELLFGKNVADKVNRFYQKDVYPRFINQTYKDIATDEVRDLLGYGGLPKGIKLYGYHDPNSIAFGFSNAGNIYMNYAKLGDELRLFESIIHESEHAQRQLIDNSGLFLKPWYKSGYAHIPQNATDEQKIFAKGFPFRGYIDSELQRLLNNYPLPPLIKGVDINPLKEAGASNRELRAAISEDYGGRLGVDLDATIDNMSNKELERYINGLNGYTDWIYNNRSINFDGIKNTLKKVPAIAAPMTILNKYAE